MPAEARKDAQADLLAISTLQSIEDHLGVHNLQLKGHVF